LPIGVQIIGGYLDDRTTIAFAGMVEREFSGLRRPRCCSRLVLRGWLGRARPALRNLRSRQWRPEGQ
jgi:hypothetical protein